VSETGRGNKLKKCGVGGRGMERRSRSEGAHGVREMGARGGGGDGGEGWRCGEGRQVKEEKD